MVTTVRHRFSWGKTINYSTDICVDCSDFFRTLSAYLIQPKPQHVSLQGVPGSGATSLVQALRPMSRFVYLDLSTIANGIAGLYQSLAQELATVSGVQPQGDEGWERVTSVLDETEAGDKPVLVVLDHFDRLLRLADAEERQIFLGELLAAMHRYDHVGFVYVSVRSMVDISSVGSASNVAQHVVTLEVPPIPVAALTDLLKRGLDEVGVPPQSALIDETLKAVGLNPAIVQMCGAAIAHGVATVAGVCEHVGKSAQALFSRVYGLFAEEEWRAFLRWRGDPESTLNPNDQRLARRILEANVYSAARKVFFSGLFEQYLLSRLGSAAVEQPAQVHLSRPLALPSPEHVRFILEAARCRSAYEINWELVQGTSGSRYVYLVKPSSATGEPLRKFYLKIDAAESIKEETVFVQDARDLGAKTPPVAVITPLDAGDLLGLKTEMATLDVDGQCTTLKEYALRHRTVPADLQQTIVAAGRALTALHRSASLRDSRISDLYEVYSYLQKAVNLANAGMSEPFQERFVRRGLLDPRAAYDQFSAFLDTRAQVLVGPTHGDLHGRNVVRDEQGLVQVIDFGRYQSCGHILSDYARLELSLVFDYLNAYGETSTEALTVLQFLVDNAPGLNTSVAQCQARHPVLVIIRACRNALYEVMPRATMNDYAIAHLGVVLSLLSMEDYFAPQHLWVPYAYAQTLITYWKSGLLH